MGKNQEELEVHERLQSYDFVMNRDTLVGYVFWLECCTGYPGSSGEIGWESRMKGLCSM